MSESKDTPRSEDFMEVAVENLDMVRGPPSPGSPVMGLDLSLAPRKDESFDGEHVQEGSIVVNFDLPDGSQGESVFKLGQTVEVLKSFVESEYGIPMELQTLYIEERPMMNPLSLLDFRETKSVEEIYVRVDGPMEDNSCKK
jgi:hypothetical protein